MGCSPSSPLSACVTYNMSLVFNLCTGLLPKPPRLRLWEKAGDDEGLDTAKRFLHITTDALVLEVEGEDKVREGERRARGFLVLPLEDVPYSQSCFAF